MVMVDESKGNGNKYMRAVDHKGQGPYGDNSWLVKDMHQELNAWGYPGGAQNEFIMKSDGEPAIGRERGAGSMPRRASHARTAPQGGAPGQWLGRGDGPTRP